MKKNPVIIRCIAWLMLFSLNSCNEENVNADGNQVVYFEVNHVNSAWVKQFRGFVMDKDGRIRTYDNPVKWNAADQTKSLTNVQMAENYKQTAISTMTVSADELRSYAKRIASIVDTGFSKPVGVGADRGTNRYYAYRYDAARQVYIPVLLGQTGDFETFSTDKNAKELLSWLQQVQDRLAQ